MKPMTLVLNVDDDDYEATYSLPPKEAVLAAWKQSLKDFNHWEYHKWDDEVRETAHGYICHGFWAKKEKK